MGRYCRSVSVIAFLLVSLFGAHMASADPNLEQAQNHFRQGEAYFKVGTYDKAVEEYEAAYALAPKPGVLFNIGLCHEKSGDDKKAVEYYEKFLRDAPDAPKATEARARREALARAISKREKELATKTEAAAKRAAGQEAAAASNWDQAIEQYTASLRLVNDPEVVFFLAEAYRGKGDMVLAKAEYERYLAKAESGKNRPQAARRIQEIDGGTAGTENVITEPAKQPMQREKDPSLVPTIVALATSGVFAGVGIVFGQRSSAIDTELADQLKSGGPPLDTGDPRYDDGRQSALVANISFAVAGVAAVTGGYLLYRALTSKSASKSASREARREARRTIVVPTASANQAGFALEMTF